MQWPACYHTPSNMRRLIYIPTTYPPVASMKFANKFLKPLGLGVKIPEGFPLTGGYEEDTRGLWKTIRLLGALDINKPRLYLEGYTRKTREFPAWEVGLLRIIHKLRTHELSPEDDAVFRLFEYGGSLEETESQYDLDKRALGFKDYNNSFKKGKAFKEDDEEISAQRLWLAVLQRDKMFAKNIDQSLREGETGILILGLGLGLGHEAELKLAGDIQVEPIDEGVCQRTIESRR